MPLAQNQGGGGSSWVTLLFFAVIIIGMWLLLIRPQQKRRRQMEQMQREIGPGDEVVTVGGLYGTVVETDDETITLEVAEGVTNRYARGAVGKVVGKAEDADDEEDADEEDEGDVDESDDSDNEPGGEPVDEAPDDADTDEPETSGKKSDSGNAARGKGGGAK